MGWPIFWTHINVEQTGDQKASAARNTAQWRQVLQMRMHEWFDEAPRGLQQAAGRGDSLPLLPLETPRSRALDEAAPVPSVRVNVRPYEDGKVKDLLKPFVPQNTREGISSEALGQPTDDRQVHVLQSGVSEEAATADDVWPFLWEQARMGEEAMSSRAQRLKCVGNGVVALQAAAAFVMLARRAGLVSR